MKSLKLVLTCCLFLTGSALFSQMNEVILLWPDGTPGALGTADEDKPTITCFPAPKEISNGAAVIICPGGGYVTLASDKEGTDFAKWFNTLGISAYVLKYRLNTWDNKKYQYPAQFNDATRAIRLVRSKSKEWDLNPDKVGIMGFSAGGHLASTVGTHFDNGNGKASDPVEKVSSRPDFMILGYPVISMTTSYTHTFSRQMVLGPDLNMELANYLSSELQVTTFTPPTFLFQTNEDNAVPAENSVLFYLALRKAGVPAEIHIFEKGQHGVGMALKDPALSVWNELLKQWLKGRGIDIK